MKIEVTEEHIKNGKRSSAFKCAIALAFTDAGFEHAGCGGDYVQVGVASPTKTIRLPREAKRFVQHFDAGLPVQPFSFEI